jgi:hypothetical protein
VSAKLTGIAAEEFKRLTRGLLPSDAAVNVFDFIRDIPYYIDPEQFDMNDGPCNMLISGRGSCFPKHYLLGSMLEKLGFRVGYSLHAFNWKDQNFVMPDDVSRLAARIPETYHMACRLFSGGKWVDLDATWNKELAVHGFPVNENWDGKRGTRPAVSAFEVISANSVREAAVLARTKFSAYTVSQRLGLSRFTAALNKWVEMA